MIRVNLPATALLLGLLLAAPDAQARLAVLDFEEMPLAAPSHADALKLVKIALGKDAYDTLHASRKSYVVKFITTADIAAATGGTEEAVRGFDAYFEQDARRADRLYIYVNKEKVARTVDAAFATVAGFADLSEEEQRNRRVMGSRRLTLGLIAHEGAHALQFETNRVGFKEELVAPGVHDKLAQDRYDEYEGYVAQYTLLGRANPRGDARGDANRHYSHLPARYLVIEGGRETEAAAPFPWGGAVDGKTSSSFDSFLSEMAAIGGRGGEGRTGGPDLSRSGLNQDEASELLGECGADFSKVSSVCPDTTTILLAADKDFGPTQRPRPPAPKPPPDDDEGDGGQGGDKDKEKPPDDEVGLEAYDAKRAR
ncbi:MAG: hypothetical protein HY816_13940 [Candidatus Wallbacteria bacterium]|nr:hypothetical protein [Candidatus Wallbacteria bacterium]